MFSHATLSLLSAGPIAVANSGAGVSMMRVWAISGPVLWGIVFVLFLIAAGRVPLRYNLRNISVRWRASLMTILAFVLVVGLLTVMMAFVNGMDKLTRDSGIPENVMIMSDGATDEVFSNLSFSDLGDLDFQEGIARNPQSDKPLSSKETFITANQLIENPRPGRPPRRLLQVRGIEDPEVSAEVHGLTLLPGGKWFSPEGVISLGENQPAAIQAVVGEAIARELAKDRTQEQSAAAKDPLMLTVGDMFTLGERKFMIVGVIQARGSTFDSEVWAKRDIMGALFGKRTYTTITMRADSAKSAKRLQDFFDKEYTKAALSAVLETDYFSGLMETNKQFLVGAIFLTAIIGVGGVMGVMNTMFASVSQRSKDIGVLRILGFERVEVLCTFLLESLVISLLGGCLGCLLGSLVNGLKATSVISSGQTTKLVVLEMIITPDTIGIGLLVTLLMGLLGGFIPSLLGMFVKPLESLR